MDKQSEHKYYGRDTSYSPASLSVLTHHVKRGNDQEKDIEENAKESISNNHGYDVGIKTILLVKDLFRYRWMRARNLKYIGSNSGHESHQVNLIEAVDIRQKIKGLIHVVHHQRRHERGLVSRLE